MPSAAEKQILRAPDVVARPDAPLAPDREQQWMLRQPRRVRESFADEVFGREDEEQRQEVWMLFQPLDIRQSYASEVLAYDPATPREMVWMLRQDDATCRSYARFVLLGEDD